MSLTMARVPRSEPGMLISYTFPRLRLSMIYITSG